MIPLCAGTCAGRKERESSHTASVRTDPGPWSAPDIFPAPAPPAPGHGERQQDQMGAAFVTLLIARAPPVTMRLWQPMHTPLH
jgi:hypothetical protein